MHPRILIIDDVFGRVLRSRRNLCKLYGLRDVTGDDSESLPISQPESEAVFCSGQREGQGQGGIENDVSVALAAVRDGWPFDDDRRWAMVLLDLRFVSGPLGKKGEPDGRSGDEAFGLRVLESLKREYPNLPVVIQSSLLRNEVIDDCRRLGAADFIQRHPGMQETSPRAILREKLREYGLLEDERGIIVGRSLPLLQVLAAARRAATGGGNILLLGESGTGKELLARYIHDHSSKSAGPYKVFHAFGTAETLQEDLLFGHVKGAFTDAKAERRGLFEQADGGTLFIDEVGDIPESLQNKLLRPIESRSVARQGSDLDAEVDLQLVLATNKSLDEYAATGRFKFDLLNRIRAYPITLPSLRERSEDIPLLANRLMESLCKDNKARWPRSFHEDAMEKLISHDWRDGNVRELRNVLERVVKDNKDSEIVVFGDIHLDKAVSHALGSGAIGSEAPSRSQSTRVAEPANWLTNIQTIRIDPDYSFLRGSWPPLQRELARLLGRYLAAAIEATRKYRVDGPQDGEINLAGAVSCVLGYQVPTVKAADFVKRLLQFDEESAEGLFNEHPALEDALQQALRSRPKGPSRSAARSRGVS
jgi:DNA-binding NtrC family response regulator